MGKIKIYKLSDNLGYMKVKYNRKEMQVYFNIPLDKGKLYKDFVNMVTACSYAQCLNNQVKKKAIGVDDMMLSVLEVRKEIMDIEIS